MKELPLWRRRELMQQQALERRLTGRPLQAGDYVQPNVGDEIRMVYDIGSAGDCFEGAAQKRAIEAKTERPRE
jgi:hypothetical protein